MYKLKIFILFLTITSIFCINTSYASDSSLPLLGKVIYIDPGHPSLDKPNAIIQVVANYNLYNLIIITLRYFLTKVFLFSKI